MEDFFRIRPAKAADAEGARFVVFPILESYALEPEADGADADLYDLDGAYLKAGGAMVSVLAFIYAMFAIYGAGAETVFYGFLLLLAGLPVYVGLKGNKGKEVR